MLRARSEDGRVGPGRGLRPRRAHPVHLRRGPFPRDHAHDGQPAHRGERRHRVDGHVRAADPPPRRRSREAPREQPLRREAHASRRCVGDHAARWGAGLGAQRRDRSRHRRSRGALASRPRRDPRRSGARHRRLGYHGVGSRAQLPRHPARDHRRRRGVGRELRAGDADSRRRGACPPGRRDHTGAVVRPPGAGGRSLAPRITRGRRPGSFHALPEPPSTDDARGCAARPGDGHRRGDGHCRTRSITATRSCCARASLPMSRWAKPRSGWSPASTHWSTRCAPRCGRWTAPGCS